MSKALSVPFFWDTVYKDRKKCGITMRTSFAISGYGHSFYASAGYAHIYIFTLSRSLDVPCQHGLVRTAGESMLRRRHHMTRRGIKLSRYLNILKWKSITIRTNHMQRLAQEGIRARSCNIHCSLSTLHRFARGLHDFETDSPTAWRSAK